MVQDCLMKSCGASDRIEIMHALMVQVVMIKEAIHFMRAAKQRRCNFGFVAVTLTFLCLVVMKRGNNSLSDSVTSHHTVSVRQLPSVKVSDDILKKADVADIPQCRVLGDRFAGALQEYVIRHYHETTDRVLMYSCESDRGHFCGGMGDRFRGMISTFLLAVLSDRKFELFHPAPAPLEDFLEPHIVDFRPAVPHGQDSRKYIASLPLSKHLMRLQRHKKFLQLLSDSERVRILRVQSNSAGIDQFIHRHPRWSVEMSRIGLSRQCNISCYFSCLAQVLFKPSKELTDAATSIVGSDPYISLQVRMGGSWATGMRIVEPFRTPPAAVQHFESILHELRSGPPLLVQSWFHGGDTRWMKNSTIFVTSDAPRFVDRISASFGSKVRFVRGGVNHTDTINLGDVKPEKFARLSPVDIRQEYFATLLSHHILSRGRHFVMAQSGFGDTAFWWSRTSASCIFVDMSNNKLAWQHHLSYDDSTSASSALSRRNKIVNIEDSPQPFY